MDTDKWKSVLVPIEVYKEIKQIAQAEGRTISGQLRIIFEKYKREQEKA
jgi:predicted DNA-binding protein